MKRVLAGTVAGLLALAALGNAPAVAQASHNPVIFIHGYGGSSSDVSAIKPNLVANGYSESEIYSLPFTNDLSNQTIAARLSTLVDTVRADTGVAKVDLIGFSMGSLSSRYYLKSLGGTAKVEHWVSIAGPNHGTSQAYWCWLVTSSKGCPQMAPSSTFLANLNSGDETPGDVKYATWVSRCDDVIDPPSTTLLDGATNTWMEACLTHTGTLRNADVAAGIADFFADATS